VDKELYRLHCLQKKVLTPPPVDERGDEDEGQDLEDEDQDEEVAEEEEEEEDGDDEHQKLRAQSPAEDDSGSHTLSVPFITYLILYVTFVVGRLLHLLSTESILVWLKVQVAGKKRYWLNRCRV